MAKNILQKLYDEEIKCEDVISWILKNETSVALQNCQAHAQQFPHQFLAFLREASAARKGDVIHSGFTPRKQPANDLKVNSSISKLDNGRNSGNTKPNSDTWSCPRTQVENKKSKSRPQFARGGESRSRHTLSFGDFISPNQESLINKSNDSNKVSKPIDLSKQPNNLGDCESVLPAVIQVKRKHKFVNTNRRITPTPVSKRELFHSSVGTSNTVFDSSCGENESHFNYNEERKWLREEKNSGRSLALLEKPSQAKIVPLSGAKLDELKPEDISLKSFVEKLAVLYAALIKKGLVPSLSVETYFIFQLLTIHSAKDFGDFDIGLDLVFQNPANCVYFATQVLFFIKELLLLLDNHTIKLLCENSRIELFFPPLRTFLIQHLNFKSSFNHLIIPSSNDMQNVTFTADVDNRKNFKNDQDFNIFKKNRDLFYELIREWASHSMDPNWSAEAALGKKIKVTVNLGESAVSYAYFAQLFQAQLVLTCRDGHLTSWENEIDLLENKLEISLEKLKMLEKRFHLPFKSGEVSPLPTFPGYQEFFKLFICQAGSYQFSQHLGNVLLSKITELHLDFVSLTEESLEVSTVIDTAHWSKILSFLKTLKLLAKFLGLVVFIPYCDGKSLNENSLLTNGRNSSMPLFDVRGFLNSAIKSNTVVLAIPWLVDFLSMMDYFAPRIPYYNDVLRSCFGVYKFFMCIEDHNNNSYSKLLFRLILEWLFQVIRSACDESACDSIMNTSLETFDTNAKNNFGINSGHLKFVDERVLYLCCPFLLEFKYILLEFNNGVGCKSSSIRKITPVSTITPVSSLASAKQLDLKLEENFLHCQPSYIKNTIDFVVDRISSNVQKHVKTFIIPRIQCGVSKEVSELSISLKENDDDKQLKSAAAAKTEELSKKLTVSIRTEAINYVKCYCPNSISTAVKSLLPDDISTIVENSIVQVTLRRTVQRTNEWLNNHVTENIQYEALTKEVLKRKTKYRRKK
ncbi:codanin 1 [Chamberlinius hualienensis]